MATLAVPAKADLIRFDNPLRDNTSSTNNQSFVDLSALGFGNTNVVLTLQSDPSQVGQVAPNGSGGVAFPVLPGPNGNQADTGANKSSAPSLGDLGWGGASVVAVGYNSNQTGNSGITLNKLTLNLYNASNVLVGSFSTPSAIQYSDIDLALQQGQGQGLFVYVLDSNQRAAWNALNPSSTWHIGLFADMGCAGTPSATCQPSNDGHDDFLAIGFGNPIVNPTCLDCTTAVPGPIVGAGAPGVIAALIGLVALHRRRRKLAV